MSESDRSIIFLKSFEIVEQNDLLTDRICHKIICEPQQLALSSYIHVVFDDFNFCSADLVIHVGLYSF